MKADVEYLKAPPYGGNRHSGSDFARKQMVAAGHEIERLRQELAAERFEKDRHLQRAEMLAWEIEIAQRNAAEKAG